MISRNARGLAGGTRGLAVALAMGAAAAALSGSSGREVSEPRAHAATAASRPAPETRTAHRTVKVDGLDIFYREAGSPDAPTVLLLHGFPTSSHMFRNLIPSLADRFHVVAPDYPGFGHSSMPKLGEFDYSFDRLAEVMDGFTAKLGLTRYALYVQDYGAPVGYRLAVKHPGRVSALVVQNGNAYEEGLREFWKPLKAYWRDPSAQNRAVLAKALELDGTRWQYTHGVRRPELISPDNWLLDQALLDRPGNREIQLQLFYSYGSNPPLYPQWQEYFRRHQPPTLVVWGRNDEIFPAEGAYPYARDLEDVELHLLDTGHFALEEDGDTIAFLMRRFLESRLFDPKRERTSSR
jgi:pimeloyl-ACP methyl ester carboxylesterase